MQLIQNEKFDCERAFYGQSGLSIKDCIFDGPCDGEPDARFGIRNVSLTKNDIIDYFDCPHHNYIQGAALHEGRIYSAEGFSNDTARPAIRIIDLKKRAQETLADLFGMGYKKEPEMIDFCGDVCYYSDVDGNLYIAEF